MSKPKKPATRQTVQYATVDQVAAMTPTELATAIFRLTTVGDNIVARRCDMLLAGLRAAYLGAPIMATEKQQRAIRETTSTTWLFDLCVAFVEAGGTNEQVKTVLFRNFQRASDRKVCIGGTDSTEGERFDVSGSWLGDKKSVNVVFGRRLRPEKQEGEKRSAQTPGNKAGDAAVNGEQAPTTGTVKAPGKDTTSKPGTALDALAELKEQFELDQPALAALFVKHFARSQTIGDLTAVELSKLAGKFSDKGITAIVGECARVTETRAKRRAKDKTDKARREASTAKLEKEEAADRKAANKRRAAGRKPARNAAKANVPVTAAA